MVSSHPLKKIICVVGPTASGKSRLAMELAEQFSGEIINADSRQFYQELNIGTDKPNLADRTQIPHHLLDTTSILASWNVADFVNTAQATLVDITQRGKIPIVVGGTGLYIKALLYGLDPIPSVPENIRRLWQETLSLVGVSGLYAELRRLDPDAAARLQPNDTQRILRCLEVLSHTGKSLHSFWSQSTHPLFDHLKIALPSPRDSLYQRINERVTTMMKMGLRTEAENLFSRFPNNPILLKTIGYAEWARFDFADEEKILTEIQKNSRHFAKRQMTWFGQEKDVLWLENQQAKHAVSLFLK